MFPPSGGYQLDVETLSGLCGSISIACWVVVFSPQIIENFRRSSAEGLSIEFVIIWLAGDVFNILGAVLQGVLPTMIILAIYYTFADVVLLGQCFYYRGFTLRDPKPEPPANDENNAPSERTPLVANGLATSPSAHRHPSAADVGSNSRTRSQSSFRNRMASLDGTHMSPAVPMHPQPKSASDAEALKPSQPRSWTQAILFNIYGDKIFGYVCAVLYLGSRVPQLLLNYRRKSTEGLNALFFLFACIGNLTYVLSIFAFSPLCSNYKHGHFHQHHCHDGEARAVYGRYILVNLSWLLGSLGTLFLDFAVFVQFFIYRGSAAPEDIPRTANGEGRGREPNER
ncbi:hypothetical protein D0865_14453 [Hortaea werneckii]|uniref:Uncharacterized protein n=1 Tax=Hortaea werneckii TaxID=91943 RepID=A0A3M7B105_HORWE|nr:hypothetical protein D0865_14453 [Hortaea werneckii]